MGVYERAIKWAGHRRWFAAINSRVAPPLDRLLFQSTNGKTTFTPRFLPTAMVTTIGKATGRKHTVPLIYVQHDGDLLLTATNWGRAHHPAWSSNLIANPQAWVQMSDSTTEFRARLLGSDERDELWPQIVAVWPAYATYRQRSGRDIRVFSLRSVDDPPAHDASD